MKRMGSSCQIYNSAKNKNDRADVTTIGQSERESKRSRRLIGAPDSGLV